MVGPELERIQQILVDAFDRPLAEARENLAELLMRESAAAGKASEQAARAARQAALESLNVAVRRIRNATSITEIGAALLESAGAYCGRVALLVNKGESLTGWRAYGFQRDGSRDQITPESRAEAWATLQIPVSSAPALAQAIESREAVVSLGIPAHLSPQLIEALALGSEEKIYLFPLSLRRTVVGVICADATGAPEGVQTAGLELLCAVAEASMEALSSRPQQHAVTEPETGGLELPVSRVESHRVPTDWNQMSPSERDMHLRAQRFARVLVADLQLYRAQEIRDGRRVRNLYGRLKDEIDKSREVYYRKFGQSATAGIDYFHLELVRTLAEDQEALLGPDYPGPLIASTV